MARDNYFPSISPAFLAQLPCRSIFEHAGVSGNCIKLNEYPDGRARVALPDGSRTILSGQTLVIPKEDAS